jgi:hypothetical protein
MKFDLIFVYLSVLKHAKLIPLGSYTTPCTNPLGSFRIAVLSPFNKIY